MTKKELRREALQKRDGIGERQRREWSEMIIDKLLAMPFYKEAAHILSYSAFRSEVLTEKLHSRCRREGKRLYLPRTGPERGTMDFYRITDETELVRGYRGIWEPEGGKRFLPDNKREDEKILMVMPGAAFDRQRNRIGYGGGYYDRYLARYGTNIETAVMLAFSVQCVGDIPAEACDIRPQYIVQEVDI